MKKILSMFLSLAMVFTMATSAFAYNFQDTADSANSEAIDALSTLEIINGVGNNNFDPEGLLTRGQICAMLTRALYGDKVTPSYRNTFTDVPITHMFRAAIDTAYRNGLVNGYGNNKFGPEDNVTYVQLTAILMNALGYDVKDFEWTAGIVNQGVLLKLYKDVNINDVNAPVTRAHAAQMIYNTFNNVKVNKIGNAYIMSSKTFLDTLGYQVIEYALTEGENAGHIYVAYQNISNKKEVKITDSRITTEDCFIMVDINTYKDGRDKVDFSWKNVTFYFNGKATAVEFGNNLTAGCKPTFIYYKDKLIAVSYNTEDNIVDIAPGTSLGSKIANADDLKAIKNDKNYNEKTSTVTYNSTTGEYKISNKYVIDLIDYTRDINSTGTRVYLMNGNYYDLNKPSITGSIITIYFNADNEISHYNVK